MSQIPKSERSWSPLETQHLVYKLRRRITQELLLSFGYSQKKLDAHVHKATEYIKDKDERQRVVQCPAGHVTQTNLQYGQSIF